MAIDHGFPNVEEFNEAVREMVTQLYGFVYDGDNLHATIKTVRFMRMNPGFAEVLLKEYDV